MGASLSACNFSEIGGEEVAVEAEPEAEAEAEVKDPGTATVEEVNAAGMTTMEESVWTQLGGDELEAALRDGLVKCLNSRYLVERARRGEPLVRRQDLPEEAFIGLERLKEAGWYGRGISENHVRVGYKWLPLAIVSYAWLSPSHPDPFGETLAVLAKAVSRMELHGVIIDFTALPQVPRSDADNQIFKRGLPCLNRFYSHPHVIVLKVSQFPEGYPRSRSYNLPEGYIPVKYNNRGWCFAEAAMAGLGKSPNFVCDVSKLEPGREVVGGSVVLPGPPMDPDGFNRKLREKSFTQPTTDTERVQNLYRDTFNERVTEAKSLTYYHLGWGPAEIVALAKAIAVNSKAETVELSENNVGFKGMKALGEVLQQHEAVTVLRLNKCGLGDGAVHELAKALEQNQSIQTLQMEDNKAGGRWWMPWRQPGIAYLAEALKVNTALTELNLETNRIGADGACSLAEALKVNTALTKLNLRDNWIGNKGACSLGEALKVNTSLTHLHLCWNEIGAEGVRSLAEALKVNTTLTVLFLRALKGHKIVAESTRSLAEALKVNTALTKLYLYRNELGEEGAHSLAEAKRARPNLQIDW